jgi:signal transduction histidine kinase
VASESRTFLEGSGLKLETSIEPDLEAETVNVDQMRIRHVFINLLTNAAKFSPAGAAVRLSAASAPLGFVRFEVTDQGPGIPPDVLPHVFERFYRAPGQGKTGAGLGLAIAREIVVAHGGSITCSSEPGAGSTFSFILPR